MEKNIFEYKMGESLKSELEGEGKELFENLYIYVTNRCNMFCKHCYLGSRLVEREEMDIKDVKAHLKFWKDLGSKKICFLGGEPTFYPYLKEAVKYAHELGYDKVLINTNLSRAAYNVISQYSSNDFNYIQTSLDGATLETHEMIRGEGTFNPTIESIKKLADQGYDIRIIMTVNRINVSEMIPMIEFAEKLGASLVKFHIMSEIGNADRNLGLGLSPVEWHHACKELKKYALNHKNRKIRISFQPTYSDFEEQTEYAEYGYKGCVGKLKERMSVFPDGKCYICSFLFDFDKSFAEVKNGIIEMNNDSVEKEFQNEYCSICKQCQFDGCIAEEMIYQRKVCEKEKLLPICRLWKVQF